jgi:hypothetical protein
MSTLVYKRTHEGDPNPGGCFGNRDCMGGVRGLEFAAVIGIGGIGRKARSSGIDRKVNWIGIGPVKRPSRFGAGRPLVTFQHFRYFGDKGPALRAKAPRLARRMYSANAPRYVVKDFTPAELTEIRRLLVMARTAPPSVGYSAPERSVRRQKGGCGSRRC